MTHNLKPSAKALNEPPEILTEVTAIIQGEANVNYHQTFLVNMAKYHSFEFMGEKYNLPYEEANYYSPGFWDFPLKWGMFFEQHKTLASWFDWFKLRKKAVHMINLLYHVGNPDPLTVNEPEFDWALENFNLQENTTVEQSYRDDDNKLKGSRELSNGTIILIAIAIVAVMIGVIVVVIVTQGQGASQVIQNVTSTPGGP